MAKLKNIIKQLSEEDYHAIQEILTESNAEKSLYLLTAMRERQLSDNKVMAELDVNANAYYTLRSRLNLKIEEYLLEQMESPRTNILKKVVSINEVLFTKKKALAEATLKKLERELLDYDLSNELTVIYKLLKKININSPDYYHYSQLYNRHVAYMLALDKAEDLLSEYFKKYGEYTMTGEETDRLALILLMREMKNVSVLYQSHRLYVYHSCMAIFHRLFVEEDSENFEEDSEPIEDMLGNVQNTFRDYPMDSIYYHLNLLFEFLKLEYYNHYKVYRKAERYYEEVNDAVSNLLHNYNLHTYPAQFLISKIKRHLRMGSEGEIDAENEALFQDFEVDESDAPLYITYMTYRAISCYYADRYEDASRWINSLLNVMSLKKCPQVQLEIKVLLALQYCMMNDVDLFSQLVNSIQRQVRQVGKENCEHIVMMTKILRVSMGEVRRSKVDTIKKAIDKLGNNKIPNHFSPTFLIKMDDAFIEKLNQRNHRLTTLPRD